ncbi:VPLPA-CTERM sorting domain-containing protein [Jannaschia sp. LMIT008]|uniref:VPLPA-CTERM sorting domain-containing protein n=1 Tax=Jannaschia maritima TaxID=3032585 RepID=UPI002810A1D8|nr:VPLPA-CTERM sorting domain-containing protein [Jannaschia sp. LMIT008]
MFKTILRSAAAATLLLAAPAAQALTFDFTGQSRLSAPTISTSAGGITLDASGRRCATTGCATGSDANIQRWGNGLGLKAFYREQHTFDGWGPNEMAILTFGTTVELQALDFHYVEDTRDQFSLWTRGDAGWTQITQALTIGKTANGAGRFSFADAIRGRVFGVATTDTDDAWKFRGATADLAAPDLVSPVPLPAGVLLLIGGLGTLVALRRGARS